MRLFHRAPVFHDGPDGAAVFQPFDEIVVTYPPVFTTSLRDATVVGFRSVLSNEGFFVSDMGFLEYRPDLRIVAFNASPTGLIAVTRLDPSSTLLADRYYDLVEDYKDRTLTEHGDAYYSSLNTVDTRQFASFAALSTLLWL